MTPQIHRTLLIATAYRDAALSLIVAAAGEGQAGMLQTPVQAAATYDEEGAELTPSEVSHYMSTGNILASFAALLPLDEWDGEQYVRVQEPDYDTIMTLTGAEQEALVGLFAEAVITAEAWQVTLDNIDCRILHNGPHQ